MFNQAPSSNKSRINQNIFAEKDDLTAFWKVSREVKQGAGWECTQDGLYMILKKHRCHNSRFSTSSPIDTKSGPLRAVHLSRHKWPGGLVN